MKTTRLLGASLLAMSAFLGACGDDDPTAPTNTATVRFVNLTGQNIDIGTGGTFAAANSGIVFGAGSQCLTVNTASPGLTFRQAGQASGTFTPASFNAAGLTPGGTYTVVLTGTGASTGTTSARMFTDTYAGANATMGALRVLNATTGATTYNLYVGPESAARPSTAVSTTFNAGAFSPFVPVNAGDAQVWLTTGTGGSQTEAFSLNNIGLTANDYSTIVIADPASGGGALRSYAVASCND